MEIVTVYTGSDACQKCYGWKRVDSEGLSWKYWEELPAQSRIGVQIGLVKPEICSRCKGTGIEPKEA